MTLHLREFFRQFIEPTPLGDIALQNTPALKQWPSFPLKGKNLVVHFFGFKFHGLAEPGDVGNLVSYFHSNPKKFVIREKLTSRERAGFRSVVLDRFIQHLINCCVGVASD